MYWLAMFAVIMEIVFRVRDFNSKSSSRHHNNKSQVVPVKELDKLQPYLDYEKNDGLDFSEFLDSETTLDQDHYYRIKNEKDNLFLTLTATEIRNCIFQIVSVNGTMDFVSSTGYFIFLNAQNTAFTTQLWEVIKRDNAEYLVPANIINLVEPFVPKAQNNPPLYENGDSLSWESKRSPQDPDFVQPPENPTEAAPETPPVLSLVEFQDNIPPKADSDDSDESDDSAAQADDVDSDPLPTTTESTTESTTIITDENENPDESIESSPNNYDTPMYDTPNEEVLPIPPTTSTTITTTTTADPPPLLTTEAETTPPPKKKHHHKSRIRDETSFEGNNINNVPGPEGSVELKKTKHRHKHKHKKVEPVEVLVKRKRRRRFADLPISPYQTKYSCPRDGIKMAWKLKWRVIKTSNNNTASLSSFKHAHFEMQSINNTCIVFNGYIGECGRPESTWTFHAVSSKGKIFSPDGIINNNF